MLHNLFYNAQSHKNRNTALFASVLIVSVYNFLHVPVSGRSRLIL